MFSVFGAYMPTVLLILVAVFTIYMAATVVLTFVCDPHRGISYLASQWPRYLVVGILCGAMLFGYGHMDRKCIRQFQDEGEALRAQCVALEKDKPSAEETMALASAVKEYNDHFETIHKAFHFPSEKAMLVGINRI